MRKKLLVVAVILLCITLTGCTNPLASLRDFFNKKTTVEVEPEKVEEKETEDLSEVSVKQPEDTRATVLYYKDHDNLLVPVMRYIPKGDLGLAKAAIKGIIYSPELIEDLKPTGLLPTLPQGTKINGAVIKDDGLAVIDLSQEFLNFNTAEGEALGVKALVYTLTEFPNIKSVQIRIDGKTIDEMPYGTKIGEPLKRTEINLVKPEKLSDKLSKVMVYYQKKGKGNYTYFAPLTKLVSGYTNSAKAALDVLLEGPAQGTGLENPFPAGTRLLDVEVNDGVAYVNFSEEILNVDSAAEERTIIKSVTLTLKEFPAIKKVRLFVNGQTLENREGIGSKEYLDVPVFVNFYE
ncbi:GerMN domain-containing protein [Lutispora thermophila]|uniref:Germination protein M n=1 Tax=Lutispora thermophila DSM 19022 TaxID=1122184 RepID=A0A1M6DTJ9_9FIRM|nr:GerMN domain-containing protein [Lutispora thermophila]SHI76531.1 germination protein M [Lutispora thermophila DSM 19022]